MNVLPRFASACRVIARHERLRAAVRFLLWPVVLVVEYPFRARLTFVFSVASLGLMWSKLRRANNRANASPVGGTARSAGKKKSRSNGLGIVNGVVSGVKTNTRTQAFRSILRSPRSSRNGNGRRRLRVLAIGYLQARSRQANGPSILR